MYIARLRLSRSLLYGSLGFSAQPEQPVQDSNLIQRRPPAWSSSPATPPARSLAIHRNGASQGVLREDKPLTNRFLRSYAYVSVESIRRQIENHSTVREHVSTSVDLPLSNEHKRILAYAAEESSGLVRSTLAPNSCLDSCAKRTCLAAELLSELGLRLSAVREKVDRVEHSFVTQTTPKARGLANVTITSMPAGADT